MSHPIRACVIQIIDPHHSHERDEILEEIRDLINTVGGVVIIEEYQKKSQPDYQTYL
jgi:50S ribosomal subunit-associated GTPase HflX